MKPMTFEEWVEQCGFHWSGVSERDWYDKARLGMIPEDEAIRIPAEKEWPENASGISIIYVSANGLKPGCAIWESYKGEDEEALIRFIPRSKPAWVPKVGEPVFTANMHFDVVRYGVVTVVANGGATVLFPDGSTGGYHFDHIKPGITAYIGKPWSEIPEA